MKKQVIPENNEIKQVTPDAVLWFVYPASDTAKTLLHADNMMRGN